MKDFDVLDSQPGATVVERLTGRLRGVKQKPWVLLEQEWQVINLTDGTEKRVWRAIPVIDETNQEDARPGWLARFAAFMTGRSA